MKASRRSAPPFEFQPSRPSRARTGHQSRRITTEPRWIRSVMGDQSNDADALRSILRSPAIPTAMWAAQRRRRHAADRDCRRTRPVRPPGSPWSDWTFGCTTDARASRLLRDVRARVVRAVPRVPDKSAPGVGYTWVNRKRSSRRVAAARSYAHPLPGCRDRDRRRFGGLGVRRWRDGGQHRQSRPSLPQGRRMPQARVFGLVRARLYPDQ